MAKREKLFFVKGNLLTRHGMEAQTYQWVVPKSLVGIFKVIQTGPGHGVGVIALVPDDTGRVCLAIVSHMTPVQQKLETLGHLVGSVGLINGNEATIKLPDMAQPIEPLDYLKALSREQVEDTINYILETHLPSQLREENDDKSSSAPYQAGSDQAGSTSKD